MVDCPNVLFNMAFYSHQRPSGPENVSSNIRSSWDLPSNTILCTLETLAATMTEHRFDQCSAHSPDQCHEKPYIDWISGWSFNIVLPISYILYYFFKECRVPTYGSSTYGKITLTLPYPMDAKSGNICYHTMEPYKFCTRWPCNKICGVK